MKNEQRRFLLLALLLLFLVARILQLFAGRVPNLLIVSFHVIPPALFALVHGARIYRSRGILIFATLCLGVGTLFESLSLRTGFPFGYYRFTDLMGPKLFDLPILLALAYLGMGYLSWVLAVVILDCQNEPLSGRKIVLLPLAASFVMTAWDFPWTQSGQTSITLGCGETEARTMECRLATSLAGFSLSTSSISYSRCISETE